MDEIRINEENGSIIFGLQDKTLASLSLKEWESDFFKKKFGELKFMQDNLNLLEDKDIDDLIESTVERARIKEFYLIELHLDISSIRIVPYLEKHYFRLMDTRITFITEINKSSMMKYDESVLRNLSLATEEDFSQILKLTHHSLTNNPSFSSRFKNRMFFTPEESEKYFEAWISNHIRDRNAFFVVLRKEGMVKGFFIYKKQGTYNGSSLYKGILTAMAPDAGGSQAHLAMQAYLYDHFPEDVFYVNNTTQLTNLAIIKNHIRSQKNLDSIELTFFRSFFDTPS